MILGRQRELDRLDELLAGLAWATAGFVFALEGEEFNMSIMRPVLGWTRRSSSVAP